LRASAGEQAAKNTAENSPGNAAAIATGNTAEITAEIATGNTVAIATVIAAAIATGNTVANAAGNAVPREGIEPNWRVRLTRTVKPAGRRQSGDCGMVAGHGKSAYSLRIAGTKRPSCRLASRCILKELGWVRNAPGHSTTPSFDPILHPDSWNPYAIDRWRVVDFDGGTGVRARTHGQLPE
jgi:hypothetical protein